MMLKLRMAAFCFVLLPTAPARAQDELEAVTNSRLLWGREDTVHTANTELPELAEARGATH